MPINIHTPLNDDLQFLVNCCKTNPTKDLALYPKGTSSASCLTANADTPVVKTKVGCNINSIHTYLNAERFDQDALIGLAHQHGILPLVYKTLKSLNSEHLTPNPELLTELKAHYQTIAQRNMLMSAELLRIMKLLDDNGIEALAFKGPTLSQMAYGDITLRQYGDLDILVDETDAYKAGKLMSENGHVAILALSILSNKTCLHTAKDFSLMSKSAGVHTELHWRLFEKKYNISLLSCASEQKCQTVSINGNAVKTLQNELLLVYLCLHGAKHAFERIEWICDIDRLIRSSNMDWEEAIALAEKSHSKRSFYLGLSLTHHLLHTPLPSTTINNIHTDDIKVLHAITEKQMSEKDSKRSDFKRNRDTFFYQAKLFDQKNDMLYFYLSTFFKISTNDCQAFVLPEKLKFLYIILRPIRLISSYLKRFFLKN